MDCKHRFHPLFLTHCVSSLRTVKSSPSPRRFYCSLLFSVRICSCFPLTTGSSNIQAPPEIGPLGIVEGRLWWARKPVPCIDRLLSVSFSLPTSYVSVLTFPLHPSGVFSLSVFGITSLQSVGVVGCLSPQHVGQVSRTDTDLCSFAHGYSFLWPCVISLQCWSCWKWQRGWELFLTQWSKLCLRYVSSPTHTHRHPRAYHKGTQELINICEMINDQSR